MGDSSRYRRERELDTVPPCTDEELQPSPTSSPPTPPSPLPVSVGPGHQHYFFISSPSNSPPFSPRSSPHNSPSPKPLAHQAIPKSSQPTTRHKKVAKSAASQSEYSPLLPQYSPPSEDEEYLEWEISNRRRPRSLFRRWLQKILCCCRITDCCPPLFTD